MSKMNVDLMLQIKHAIAEQPHRHRQAMWSNDFTDMRPDEDCGTTMCIAGWALAFNGDTVLAVLDRFESMHDTAQRYMGITLEESHELFYEMSNSKALALLDELIERGKNQL